MEHLELLKFHSYWLYGLIVLSPTCKSPWIKASAKWLMKMLMNRHCVVGSCLYFCFAKQTFQSLHLRIFTSLNSVDFFDAFACNVLINNCISVSPLLDLCEYGSAIEYRYRKCEPLCTKNRTNYRVTGTHRAMPGKSILPWGILIRERAEMSNNRRRLCIELIFCQWFGTSWKEELHNLL